MYIKRCRYCKGKCIKYGLRNNKQRYRGNGYKFGFNGMEKDNEVKGIGNSYDFGARIYDSRLGRWLSLDGKSRLFTCFSPYNFCINNPIIYKDIDGNIFVLPNGTPIQMSYTGDNKIVFGDNAPEDFKEFVKALWNSSPAEEKP